MSYRRDSRRGAAHAGVVRRAPESLPAAPFQPPGSARKTLMLWLVAAGWAAGVFLAVQAWQALRAPAPEVEIRTAQARAGALVRSLRVSGETAAEKSTMLRAPVLRGRRSRGSASDFSLVVLELASPGKRVKAGDLVASFDPLNMRNRLDDYEADYIEEVAELRTLRTELSLLQLDYRQKTATALATMQKAELDLQTAPVRSAIQREQFRLVLEEARGQRKAFEEQAKLFEYSLAAAVRRAELDVGETRLGLERSRASMAKLQVRAPMDGLAVVQERVRGSELSPIRAGDEVAPGQPYLQIVDPAHLLVEARASQVDSGQLRLAALSVVRFPAIPDLELTARVYSIGPLAAAGRRTGYYAAIPVYLKFEGTDPRMIPGLSVSADIRLSAEEFDCIIPREAVTADPATGAAYALVRNGDEWHRREVELGPANHVEVAVLSGLEEGDVVRLDAN